MNRRPHTEIERTDSQTSLPRRRFLAIGAGVGATLLAGCAGTGGETPETGAFRLLVSDQPADIGDFDSLAVSFETARIFRAEGGTTEDAPTTTAGPETTTQDSETTTTATETTASEAETTAASTTETADAEDGDGEADDAEGYSEIDLEGATVDLTRVIGEDAIGVFDGELETGRYVKVELHVSTVEGIVDGEEVAVKVPSEKLQITTPFEVTAEEPVEFVFDINVIKRGPTNGYNLTPVISESGVAGRDVEYEEVPANGTTTAE